MQAKDEDSMTPLMLATRNGHIEVHVVVDFTCNYKPFRSNSHNHTLYNYNNCSFLSFKYTQVVKLFFHKLLLISKESTENGTRTRADLMGLMSWALQYEFPAFFEVWIQATVHK